MPPKKKSGKGKKSGKKKKGKKSATTKEPKMTVEEAILAFQIEIKEKSMQDLLYDSQALKERKERLKQRNSKLKEEQLAHIKTLLKQVKEKDNEVEQAVEVGHEQVEKALLEKFEVMKKEEHDLQEHKSRIEHKDDEIREVRRDIKRREDYKDYGQHESAKQIKILLQELQDMEDSHDDIAAHLDRSLNIAKDEIETFTESTISKQKDIASEKVANALDKDSCAEIMDNKWLKKEVAIHREAHAELNSTVEELEKQNLEIMTELFDCKVEDLKFTRKFYLTCVENDSGGEDEEGEEVLAEHGEISELEEKPEDLLDNYYFVPGDDVEESPRLGPMELQLLSVVGTTKPILGSPIDVEGNELVPISSAGGPSKVLRPENYGNPSHWPVTNNMLQSLSTAH